MTRSFIAALILALAVPTVARAGGVLLPAAPHEVQIKSWKTKGGLRPKVGMHIRVDKAHPESTIVIQRQKRSKSIELTGEVTEEQLVNAAHEATQWADHLTLKTENESTKQPHDTLTFEPSQVMRPGSRFRVQYTTRDKQKGTNHGLIVGGQGEVVDTVHDMITLEPRNITKSGANAKPARAWAHTANIFVTAPEVDDKMVKEGKGLLHEAQSKREHIEKLNSDLVALQASGNDPTRAQEIPVEIGTLTTQIDELTTRGNAMVLDGGRSKVRVLSVGGLPVNTNIQAANVRLAAEGGAVRPNFSVNSHLEHGMIHEELDAVDHDKVKLSVHFAGESANSSVHSIAFRVGEPDEKAAFTYQGRKYYPIKVDDKDISQHNADPAE